MALYSMAVSVGQLFGPRPSGAAAGVATVVAPRICVWGCAVPVYIVSSCDVGVVWQQQVAADVQ